MQHRRRDVNARDIDSLGVLYAVNGQGESVHAVLRGFYRAGASGRQRSAPGRAGIADSLVCRRPCDCDITAGNPGAAAAIDRGRQRRRRINGDLCPAAARSVQHKLVLFIVHRAARVVDGKDVQPDGIGVRRAVLHGLPAHIGLLPAERHGLGIAPCVLQRLGIFRRNLSCQQAVVLRDLLRRKCDGRGVLVEGQTGFRLFKRAWRAGCLAHVLNAFNAIERIDDQPGPVGDIRANDTGKVQDVGVCPAGILERAPCCFDIEGAETVDSGIRAVDNFVKNQRDGDRVAGAVAAQRCGHADALRLMRIVDLEIVGDIAAVPSVTIIAAGAKSKCNLLCVSRDTKVVLHPIVKTRFGVFPSSVVGLIWIGLKRKRIVIPGACIFTAAVLKERCIKGATGWIVVQSLKWVTSILFIKCLI